MTTSTVTDINHTHTQTDSCGGMEWLMDRSYLPAGTVDQEPVGKWAEMSEHVRPQASHLHSRVSADALKRILAAATTAAANSAAPCTISYLIYYNGVGLKVGGPPSVCMLSLSLSLSLSAPS